MEHLAKHWFKRVLFSGCATFAMTGMLSAAHAQESRPSSEPAPDDKATVDNSVIVVTAQRREQAISDVPMSITAIGGDEAQKLGIESADDLGKLVPGFTFAQSSTGAQIYTLRGVGLNDNTVVASPAVSIYTDEVAIPYSAMARGGVFDLERVEVLKGPQGTLYGQNSTGGAVNYITNKPTSTLEAGANLSYGRFERFDAGGYISGPLSDTLEGRVAFQTSQGGPWQVSETRGDELGRRDFSEGRILLSWEPSADISVLASLSGWRDRSEVQAPQLTALAPNPSAPVAFYPVALVNSTQPGGGNRIADWNPNLDYGADNSYYRATLRADFDISPDITLTSISAYQKFDQNQLNETDGSAVDNISIETIAEIESISQEIRFTGVFDRLRVVVGGNYQTDESTESSNYDFLVNSQDPFFALVFGSPPHTSGDVTAIRDGESYAVFGNVDYELTDAWSIEAGARYTKSKLNYSNCTLDTGNGNLAALFTIIQTVALGGPAPANLQPQQGGCVSFNPDTFIPELFNDELDEDNVSWRIGMKYKVNPGLLIYGNISRGYKVGIHPTLIASTNAQFAPAVQEELTAFEIGLKGSVPGGWLDYSAAAYYYDYKDKQVLGRIIDPVFGSLETLINVPASVRGVEAQVNLRPVEGLQIGLAGAYVDAKLGDFVGFDQAGAVKDFSGSQTTFAPKWQFVLNSEYRRPLDESLEGFVGLSVSYNSEATSFLGTPDLTFVDPNGVTQTLPLGAIEARTLTDVRLGVSNSDRGWSAYLWGRNIFDETYNTYAVKVTDTANRYMGDPATYGVTFTIDF